MFDLEDHGLLRSETLLAPVYGGETSEPRAVGFDVDKDAHTVSA